MERMENDQKTFLKMIINAHEKKENDHKNYWKLNLFFYSNIWKQLKKPRKLTCNTKPDTGIPPKNDEKNIFKNFKPN